MYELSLLVHDPASGAQLGTRYDFDPTALPLTPAQLAHLADVVASLTSYVQQQASVGGAGAPAVVVPTL